ncbi:MAG: NADH-quinone oxidoreductase subunit H, partial [Polyangia bacterium]
MSGAQLLSYGQPGFAIAAALIKILAFIVLFAMGLASLLTWLERRQSAMMQDRLGPNRANIGRWRAWGILH